MILERRATRRAAPGPRSDAGRTASDHDEAGPTRRARPGRRLPEATTRRARPVRRGSWIGSAAVAIVLLALYLTVGPSQIGGPATYVVISGTSMNPMLHKGDLAVVRERSGYAVGDAVLYRSRSLRANVLHRIKARDGDRLVMRGDNNDFDDGERPTMSQVRGQYWFHVPGAGSMLAWLQEPVHAAIFLGVLVLFAMGGGGEAARRRRQRGARGTALAGRAGREPWPGEQPEQDAGEPGPAPVEPAPERRSAATTGGRPSPARPAPGPAPSTLATAAAALGVLACTLLVLSVGKPTTTAVTVPDASTHEGSFSYSARTWKSVVYPEGRVASGEPVFVRLVHDLDVRFAYELAAKGEARVGGAISLRARVSDGQGWERAIPVTAARRFSGDKATVTGRVDVDRLVGMVDRMRRLTGSGVNQVNVSLEPVVDVVGTLGAEPFADRFAPSLRFTLDNVALRVEQGADTTGAVDEAGVPLAAAASPMTPVEQNEGTVERPALLSLGPVSPTVGTARTAGVLGLVAAALLGLLALVARRRHGDRTEHDRIAGRLGDLLVDTRTPPARDLPVTDVADIESVAQVAERFDRLVLHFVSEEGHEYVVDDGTTVYRYRAPAVAEPPARAA